MDDWTEKFCEEVERKCNPRLLPEVNNRIVKATRSMQCANHALLAVPDLLRIIRAQAAVIEADNAGFNNSYALSQMPDDNEFQINITRQELAKLKEEICQ